MKKKIGLVLGALVIGIASLTTAGVIIKQSFGENVEALLDEYALNSFISVPSRNITKGGVTKPASVIITSPNGNVYKNPKITLDEIGIWNITYTADFDGFPEEENEQIYVYQPTYYAGSGSVRLGTNNVVFANSGEGLLVTLKKGDKFEYGEIIDLNQYNKKSFIGIGLLPATIGTVEATSVTVRITDAYNDNVYVDYIFHNPNTKDVASYVGYGTLEASFSGTDAMMGAETLGSTEKWHVNSSGYGAYTRFSFDGQINPTQAAAKKDPISNLMFDIDNLYAMCSDKLWGQSNKRYPSPDGTQVIADLKRTDFSSDSIAEVSLKLNGVNPWSTPFCGFKTNEVKLSFWADGYSGSECSFFIKSIAGADFSQTKSYDTIKPLLEVNTLGYEEDDLPVAKVGVKYPLFNYDSYDNITRPTKNTISVYRSKNGFKLASIPVIDNAFVPPVAGEYIVEYLVSDGSNLQTRNTLYVNAFDDVDLPILDVDGTLPITASCGESIVLPEATASAGSGSATVSVFAEVDGVRVLENSNNLYFDRPGTYKISYVATDYIGQSASRDFEIEVTANDNPVLACPPTAIPGFIVGSTYTIPTAYALDFKKMVNGEPTKIPSIITVRENRTVIDLVDNKYTPTSATLEKVTVIYSFFSDSGATVYTKDVPLIRLNNKRVVNEDILEYFICGDGVDKTVDNDNVYLDFTKDSSVTFLNAVSTGSSSFSFLINEGTLEKAAKVNFIFTDVVDSNKQIKVSFINKGHDQTASYISINDGDKYDCSGNFSGLGNPIFEFTLDEVEKKVVSGLTKIPFETFYESSEFDGFNYSRAYLTISLEGVDEECILNIVQIASQRMFANDRGDRISPIIVAKGIENTSYSLGEVISTFPAYATDTLQSETSMSFSISNEDGDYIKLLNGEEAVGLDPSQIYYFKIEKYGNYYANYYAEDAFGNDEVKTVSYICPDLNAPVIGGEFRSIEVKVGKTVDFGSYSFVDDYTLTDNMKYAIFAHSPKGIITLIKQGTGGSTELSYTFNETGKWVITLAAFDEGGNATYRNINVYVI